MGTEKTQRSKPPSATEGRISIGGKT